MPELFSPSTVRPLKLTVRQDRLRDLKRGYPWIFAHSLITLPPAEPGTLAIVRDKDGEIIAKGMYDPACPIAFRVIAREETLTDELILERMERAITLRTHILTDQTNCCRLMNGEGDGLPGLVCDRYGDLAVLQVDGEGPANFWQTEAIASQIVKLSGVRQVYLKPRSGSEGAGKALAGGVPSESRMIIEHGARFGVNIIDGQKSGFFLDQRENRLLIRNMAKDRSVLNLFGYTGGFSIAAGLGGASSVTTVDISKPAILASEQNWELNGLAPRVHSALAMNAFDFLDGALEKGERFELIIADPPSFVPSRAAFEKGRGAYIALFSKCIGLLSSDGLMAAASCSSHVNTEDFLDICIESFSRARRRARVVGVHGQPSDHPFPLPCRELQYLKFVLLQTS